jgi:serine O-acetyltransferase
VIIGAGAKVLGPITVGDNARIGANSVVVDPVPADTTVVGVPARPVDRKLPRPKGDAAADFDPYGMPCDDSPDPLQCELENLRAELAELEARVARIQSGQTEFGRQFDTSSPDPIQREPASREPAAE